MLHLLLAVAHLTGVDLCLEQLSGHVSWCRGLALVEEHAPDNLGGFSCELGFCLGGSGFPVKPLACCGKLCTAKECCGDEEVCFVGICKDQRELGQSCAKDTHCASGHCGCMADGGSGAVNLGVCYEPGSVAMGDSCKVDAECATGRCTAVACVPGKCVCDDDADCGAAYYCDQGIIGDIGTNTCQPKKDDGVTCTGSNKCLSGHCSTESEVDPCGYCYTPDSGEVGDDCRVDAECVTDRCGYVCGDPGFGKCKCNDHPDCGPGGFCHVQLGGDNLCEDRRADFDECNADYKCLSGFCSGGVTCISCKCYTPGSQAMGEECVIDEHCDVGKCKDTLGFGTRTCVCDTDADCGADEYCDQGFVGGIGANSCHDKKAECETCDRDGKCVSDHCTAIISGKCITLGSKSIGQTCCHDDQCDTGKCEGGVCTCNDDGDCSGGEVCFTPAFGANYCAECKNQSNGTCSWATEYCDEDAGTCEAIKSTGASGCSHDYECYGVCGSDGKCYCQADAFGDGEGCPSSKPICKDNTPAVQTDNECVECTSNSHCGTTAEPYCASFDACVECTSNSHCSDTEYCNTVGSCAAKRANGSSCTDDDQCLGTCGSDGKCYCSTDNGGCSGATPICKSNNITIVTDNECVECTYDSHCPSSEPQCNSNDVCVECISDGHCSSTQYCTSSYSCAALKYEGSSCSSDSQCYANCVGGLCRCNSTTNNGCPSSKPFCIDGGNLTSQEDNDCKECKNDGDCSSSEYCSTGNNCLTLKVLGASCSYNDQCESGQCEGSNCVCGNDADCVAEYGSGADCKKPAISGYCGGTINYCERNGTKYCE